MKTTKQIRQLNSELRTAGMTQYGFMKLETAHLPEIIHEDEHIKGVAYGRLEKSIDAVMLVATDKRVLFIDCKPLYQNWDEISYDVVSGVKTSLVGPFAGVVLHTRVKDYSIRFVNVKCANIFRKYIEQYVESGGKVPEQDISKTAAPAEQKIITKTTRKLNLDKNIESENTPDTAVLSTVGKDGGAHGSVVHYVTDKDENFYILTKADTIKAKNIAKNNQVALTIHQTNSLKYLEITGIAEIEKDKSIIKVVFSIISTPRRYLQGLKMPPITKIEAGKFIVLKITPTDTVDNDYSRASW
jgi:general stress protein 26